ncbi:hypothetical protein RHSIM_Rhsim09G0108900 [Rhododendron simsii]|uniref:Uncharacterized protein n=1 Tax=Rhododendron simsii TaxID=118357 RepID=A0A834GF06_RHOSS|nr:hypothetical protein RHSIM_Rhsim09G0108900 [Rhododendron simsii]
MEELSNKKRVRDDSDEPESDSPEVKKLRDDLLGNLDDSDLCTTSQDLDSFMKSFEEEISSSPPTPPPASVVDLTSESGESRPELGYLLEASDDELGLPPSTTESPSEFAELERVPSDASGELGELWRFDEDQIPSYDAFEFGIGGGEVNFNGGLNNGEYVDVAFDGLFDYSDLGYGSYDTEDVPLWRPETTPAQ